MPRTDSVIRCDWCKDDELYIAYHDTEWGVPLHDDKKLFELLTLEGAQAGLSWLTILKRRAGYKKAFVGFDLEQVARFDEQNIKQLLNDPGIIRNKLKVRSTIKNAQVVLEIQKQYGSFNNYLWQYVTNQPIQHNYTQLADIPSTDAVASAMSKDLQKRGCSFVGPTICYGFMQASGMVNDHLKKCFRYQASKMLH